MTRRRPPPLPEVSPMHAPNVSANAIFDCQEFKSPCAAGSRRPNHPVNLTNRLTGAPNPCDFFGRALAPPSPPPLGKRMPFDANGRLLPLQTASNGDSAMSDFQRLLPLQTAINGNPAMNDFQRLLPLQTAINGDPPMSDSQRLLPLQTAINGNPAMSDFRTADPSIRRPGQHEGPAWVHCRYGAHHVSSQPDA